MRKQLFDLGQTVGAALKERRETLGVVESSAGGLISAALLAVSGASAYFVGGTVVYTHEARRTLLRISDDQLKDVRKTVDSVVGNAEALRAVTLDNADEPPAVFTPYRAEG